jgi:hypothetical protein
VGTCGQIGGDKDVIDENSLMKEMLFEERMGATPA